MQTKICKCCNYELDISMFNKNGKYTRSNCKNCCRQKSKKYTGKYKEQQKSYREKNKNSIQEYHKNYFQKNKDIIKLKTQEYYIKNKENILIRTSNYRKSNKDWYNKYKKEYRNKNKIISNIRRGIWGCLKGKQKKSSSIEYIGCSIEKFKEHLQFKFQEGMSFENYGQWHIDHIKPLCSFNFNDADIESELKIAWHYTNLQPLWSFDNLSKGKTQG